MFKIGDKVKLKVNFAGYKAGTEFDIVSIDHPDLKSRGVWIFGNKCGVSNSGKFDINDNAEYFDLIDETEVKPTQEYSSSHYDAYYELTESDIDSGKIKLDAYFVAKQWKVGSKDDSGALFHSLKTIARFGEKNSIEREIKALYNQAKAMARIYGVDLEENK